jgi:crossover junction endodeoxyribonuclease RuvC
MVAALEYGCSVFEYAPRKAKEAIVGNGAASKEQVSLMIRKTLGVEISAEHLDATDALAVALCHYYERQKPVSNNGASSWKSFIAQHPDRVKK